MTFSTSPRTFSFWRISNSVTAAVPAFVTSKVIAPAFAVISFGSQPLSDSVTLIVAPDPVAPLDAVADASDVFVSVFESDEQAAATSGTRRRGRRRRRDTRAPIRQRRWWERGQQGAAQAAAWTSATR